jgi:ATP-dependent RNA helicase DDX31/DBP7
MYKYATLTNIQKEAIPRILKAKNVVMKSETGSGKTLTYLIPLIEHLHNYSITEELISRDKGTYCIIFSPTRELCTQIDLEMQKLLKLFAFIVCTTIMGGENPKKEKARLRKGCTVLVCTPGRFLYHLKNTKTIGLSKLQYMIIDEADRMLDMGFEKEMNECLQLIKKRCPDKFTQEPDLFHSSSIKINFVSATISPKVASLGAKLMKEYDQVGFDVQETATQDDDATIKSSIPRQVKQFWMEVPS